MLLTQGLIMAPRKKAINKQVALKLLCLRQHLGVRTGPDIIVAVLRNSPTFLLSLYLVHISLYLHLLSAFNILLHGFHPGGVSPKTCSCVRCHNLGGGVVWANAMVRMWGGLRLSSLIKWKSLIDCPNEWPLRQRLVYSQTARIGGVYAYHDSTQKCRSKTDRYINGKLFGIPSVTRDV